MVDTTRKSIPTEAETQRLLEAEYRAMAAEQNDEDRAVRAAMRRRRRLSLRVDPGSRGLPEREQAHPAEAE